MSIEYLGLLQATTIEMSQGATRRAFAPANALRATLMMLARSGSKSEMARSQIFRLTSPYGRIAAAKPV
jgi:hypothetical protein